MIEAMRTALDSRTRRRLAGRTRTPRTKPRSGMGPTMGNGRILEATEKRATTERSTRTG